MSIAQLPGSGAAAPRVARDRVARDRLLALVTQIEGDGLDVAEEMLAGIVAHQHAGTRGLTSTEVSVLDRLGVGEAALQAPTALPATTRGRLWERQAEQQSCTVSEAADMLGVTAARVRQRCTAGTLLAQRRSEGWRLPRFQFPDGREPRGWSAVAQAIPPGTPLLLTERVLTSPAPRLRVDGESLAPLEWLAQGGDPATAAAAVDDALNRLP
ncbi:helix-turn-helix domain-containing protein [Leucobacter triazinivorans]|uniref:DNA-binding protein n=1 Tax=Leucobacter triazinivorans TaxID=1784719 RepID=A0A4P6KBA4_9MICO|nr:helix-turn-helix domain-containing protein [Leucobacter triazinivorans]QBE47556.1 DNA-binding protein [Leucobacter triazinivorans]